MTQHIPPDYIPPNALTLALTLCIVAAKVVGL